MVVNSLTDYVAPVEPSAQNLLSEIHCLLASPKADEISDDVFQHRKLLILCDESTQIIVGQGEMRKGSEE